MVKYVHFILLLVLSNSFYSQNSEEAIKYYESGVEAGQGTDESDIYFEKAIMNDSLFHDAYFERSIAYNKRGDFATGFKFLNRAVEISPINHLGYRGWYRLNFLRDYKGAINDFKRLDSLTPNVVDSPWGENIYYLMGLAYKGLEDYDNSLKFFDLYVKTESDSSWVDPNVYLYKGIIHFEEGELEKADKNFDACLKYNKNSSESFFYKAKFLLSKEDKWGAKKNIIKTLNLYVKGNFLKDPYFEVQNQLYLEDIFDFMCLLK